jgi:hypothetical protein
VGDSKGKRFLKFPERGDWLWGPHSLLFNGYHGTFPGIMWCSYEVAHSPPSGAEVKSIRASTPPVRLHGVDKENLASFTLYSNLT